MQVTFVVLRHDYGGYQKTRLCLLLSKKSNADFYKHFFKN